MDKEKQIEFERNEIAQIIAENFRLNDEKYDASDFEWAAYQVQTAGYRKVEQGEWILEREPNGKPYYFHCSVCDKESKTGTDFCPNCGAIMKGATK